VQPAECGADPGDVDLADLAVDVLRHEVTLGLDERDHLGPEAEVGPQCVRRRARPSGRSEEFRVLAPIRRTNLARWPRPEVAVGDPAAERLDLHLLPGPNPLGQLLGSTGVLDRKAFALGANAFALRLRRALLDGLPGIQSPKISTRRWCRVRQTTSAG